ncbi:uncharacterized protein K444DRAFT_243135 [Hyaloscypha bicolor E]|uniref:Uncharacterized protein n=1 Tax=Hyaloscypha bicolor E TaxID=1095630 RepID=A0A2J6SM56_9HELO|nr:uncharacterized protein K444DRAFT_243135 [Hyaloscypha bicolor E]PMD51837.1 hypothetical protein K444DRAFT_243135 [Hyaloscypha bicolor E]
MCFKHPKFSLSPGTYIGREEMIGWFAARNPSDFFQPNVSRTLTRHGVAGKGPISDFPSFIGSRQLYKRVFQNVFSFEAELSELGISVQARSQKKNGVVLDSVSTPSGNEKTKRFSVTGCRDCGSTYLPAKLVGSLQSWTNCKANYEELVESWNHQMISSN